MAIEFGDKEIKYVLNALVRERNQLKEQLATETGEDIARIGDDLMIYESLIKDFQEELALETARSQDQAAKQFDLEEVKKNLKEKFGE